MLAGGWWRGRNVSLSLLSWKYIYTTLANGLAPPDSSWFFSFWAVQLAGNLSLMDWSSLSERPSAQPIRLIWSCRIAFFGVKTPCQTLGLRSFVLQNEIDRAAATGGMPAGRLNCGAWRAIMNRLAETASPLLHYKCSLLTAICNQWAQAFRQSPQIRQWGLCVRVGGATGPRYRTGKTRLCWPCLTLGCRAKSEKGPHNHSRGSLSLTAAWIFISLGKRGLLYIQSHVTDVNETNCFCFSKGKCSKFSIMCKGNFWSEI